MKEERKDLTAIGFSHSHKQLEHVSETSTAKEGVDCYTECL